MPGDDPPVAVKVWSDVVHAEVWVVADDLPREDWPTDAPVYTHAEVKILARVGSGVLAWVHIVKEAFGARVIESQRAPKRS
jgi:hypothetical protein